MKPEECLVDPEYLVDKAISVVGENAFSGLPKDSQKSLWEKLLFDRFCPAGGQRAATDLYDGPRYWERRKEENDR